MAIEKIRHVSGTALPLCGDSIDTDRIIPARFLRSVSFEGLEQHLFEDDRTQADASAPGTHPISNRAYAGSSILLVNANFGCGSSREHAPQAIRRRGIRAVVGESFSEIFFGNSVVIGLPCVTASHADMERLRLVVPRRRQRQPRPRSALSGAGDRSPPPPASHRDAKPRWYTDGGMAVASTLAVIGAMYRLPPAAAAAR
jgi:3-isopropylmalate dehydratase small subunit